MLSVKTLILVMLRSALIVAFLSIPNPVVAFTGLKNWSRKALYTKIDLCTQACYSQIIPGLYLSNARATQDRLVLSHLGITHALTTEAQRLPKRFFMGTNVKNFFIRAPDNPTTCLLPYFPIARLYLSNARAAADRSVLSRLGITHVLTIEAKRLPKSTFLDTNICTLFIRAYDSPQTNIMPYFPMANAFIDEGLQNGKVLVHCHFGVSRSATLVIAYLMSKYQLSFEDAFTYVRERRRFISPNSGFVAQLREYQRRNYEVKNVHKLEAFVNIQARKHKYKIASAAAVFFGILVPTVALIG